MRGGRGRPAADQIVELKDTLEWRERLPLDFGRESAHARGRSGVASAGRRRWRPALVLIGSTLSGACQARAGQGRGHVRGGRRLCPAGSQARRGCRVRGDHRRLDPRDPVQAPGGYSDRQIVRRGARLCRLGAARSRRLGDPAVVGAQGDHQHHDGRRTGVRRSAARHLEGSASRPSARGGPRTGRARAGRRARVAPAARDSRGARSVRRSACAHRCSRPSSASCSKCPTASASRRC